MNLTMLSSAAEGIKFEQKPVALSIWKSIDHTEIGFRSLSHCAKISFQRYLGMFSISIQMKCNRMESKCGLKKTIWKIYGWELRDKKQNWTIHRRQKKTKTLSCVLDLFEWVSALVIPIESFSSTLRWVSVWIGFGKKPPRRRTTTNEHQPTTQME